MATGILSHEIAIYVPSPAYPIREYHVIPNLIRDPSLRAVDPESPELDSGSA